MGSNNSQQYCLNEYQYRQVKQVNKIAFDLLQGFVYQINKLFKSLKEYIIDPYRLLEQLDKICFLGETYYQTIEYILDLPKNKQETINDGHTEIYRHYNEDVWLYIIDVVSDKKIIIKSMSKKMLKNLTDSGRKEMQRIRGIVYTRFKKIQSELGQILEYKEDK